MNDELILRLVRVLAVHEFTESVRWRSLDGKVVIADVLCGDLFWWATADSEPIATVGDIELLDKSLKDSDVCGEELYCCRRRKMRPQHPYYKHIDDDEKVLFDACGPERTPEDCG